MDYIKKRRVIGLATMTAVLTVAAGNASTSMAGDASPAAPNRAAESTAKASSSGFYLSGIWVLAGTFMDKQDKSKVAAPGRLSEAKPEEFAMFMQAPVLKGDFQAQHLKALGMAAQGKAVDDMGAMCLPQGMPDFWFGPYAFEFLQTKTQLNISQEWNEQTRRIYIDGRPHPADYDPSYNGHSIGHWEGSELVVDTAGIRTDTKIGVDSHHSDAMHIVERMKMIAPNLLQVEMTVYDSKAFMQPWVAVYKLRHKPSMEILEYSCEDNNRNPVDANGVTQAIIAPSK